MINIVGLASGVQQSDSVTHIHVPILFQILFPFRLLQNIEQCYSRSWLVIYFKYSGGLMTSLSHFLLSMFSFRSSNY